MKQSNISIQIGIGFFAVLALSVYYASETLEFILAAAVHEVGHIAAFVLMGESDIKIEFKALGIYIINGSPLFSIKKETVILLFGPITGLFAAIIARRYGSFSEISAMLSLVNLLPIKGTDGGSLIRMIFPKWMEGGRKVIMVCCSFALAVLPSVFMCCRISIPAAATVALLYMRGELCSERYI